MSHDIVLEGNVFIQDSFHQCCIGIDDGRINAVKKILKGDVHHRFSKKVLMPAGCDIHVHFRDPGLTQKETFQTGSTAAVYGGISCIFDMPNTLPQTTSISILKDKINTASRSMLCDYGLYAGITDHNFKDVIEIARMAQGFKIFLGSTTNSLLLSPLKLPLVFEMLAQTKRPVLCHAEDAKCLKRTQRMEKDLKDHHRSRPPLCETTAIKDLLRARADHDVPLHICHVSSKDSLDLLKDRPTKITYGITPHHSLLNIDSLPLSDTRYKVNPPLRPKEHMHALFEALSKDQADVLESDHAPHLLKEKNEEFNTAPSGVPGVETMIPLFIYLAIKEKISFSRLIDLTCVNPAKLTGIRKGSLKVGFDGDIAVYDLRHISTVCAEMLHSKAEWTPFEGYNAVFPTNVFIRGSSVIEDGECICRPGFGDQVRTREDND